MMDLKNIFPRNHVEFIVQSADNEVSFETFEFVPGEGQHPWDVIRERQQAILDAGNVGANTCNYRTLLDRDGYRD